MEILETEEKRIIDYATIERTFDKAGDAKAQWLMIQAISEAAPPKDWAEKMKDLEQRNARLSRFIMDWLGRELDILPEGDLSISDLLPAVRKSEE